MARGSVMSYRKASSFCADRHCRPAADLRNFMCSIRFTHSSVGGAPMKQIALLSLFAILVVVAFTLHINSAPASDRGTAAQINTHELTLNAKNLVDNTVAEAF